MRRVLPVTAVLAAALVVTALAACSSGPSGTSTAKGCPAAASGGNTSKVKVSGTSKEEPSVKVDGTLSTASTQRAVVTGGSGTAVKDGSVAVLSYAVFDGTGKKLGSGGYGSSTPEPVTVSKSVLPAGLYKTLVCTTVGSRVVGVVPPKDLGKGATSKTDAVFVLDVRSISKPVKTSAWTKNVPAVDLTANPPTVTIPSTDPDPDLRVKILKQGSGDTVKSGDSVTVDYQGTTWSTKKVFDQSFGKQPIALTAAPGQVIDGFAAAMIGQKVGTTLLVTIPPKYGYTKTQNAELGGQTLVFLIEIEKDARG